MGLARRILRFGREIGMILDCLKMAEQLSQESGRKKLIKMLKILGNISLVIYFLTDHVIFINGVTPLQNK